MLSCPRNVVHDQCPLRVIRHVGRALHRSNALCCGRWSDLTRLLESSKVESRLRVGPGDASTTLSGPMILAATYGLLERSTTKSHGCVSKQPLLVYGDRTKFSRREVVLPPKRPHQQRGSHAPIRASVLVPGEFTSAVVESGPGV